MWILLCILLCLLFNEIAGDLGCLFILVAIVAVHLLPILAWIAIPIGIFILIFKLIEKL